jgi:hypothetical protein
MSYCNVLHSLGITDETMRKGERGIRPEAVHIRGTEDMSTQDVFVYFKDYAPGNIEWIDDSSCKYFQRLTLYGQIFLEIFKKYVFSPKMVSSKVLLNAFQ